MDFYLDPLCPWAWLTSRWADSLARNGQITIKPHLFSLVEINQKAAPPPTEEKEWPLRLLAVAGENHGEEGLWRAYTALGELHHDQGRPYDLACLAAAAAQADLPEGIVRFALSEKSAYESVRAAHAEAANRGVFGVPTIAINNGPLMFGPVVNQRLDQAQATLLLEHVSGFSGSPHLFEIKKVKREPILQTAGQSV